MLLISSICYGAIALVSLVFGIVYLTRAQFMPYHSLALGKPWSEVEPNIQTLILALMRVAGGGFLATGLTIVILLSIPFQAREPWAVYSICAIGSCTSFASCYATFMVHRRTLGNPPLRLSLGMLVLIFVGFICSVI